MSLELILFLATIAGLSTFAFFWCGCCECALATPTFSGSVVSGTWLETSDFFRPAYVTSGAGELLFPNSYSTGSDGGVVRWWISTSAAQRPYFLKFKAAYVDDDNYLFATADISTGGVLTVALYQRIGGVETQIGQTVTTNVADSYVVNMEISWNGTTATCGDAAFATATTTENSCSTFVSTGGPCTHNPSSWRAGIQLVSVGSGSVRFVCYGIFKRNDETTSNTIFGGHNATCNSTNCCACTGNYTEEVAVTFSGATASTEGGGCCPDPSILNTTFILSNATAASQYGSLLRSCNGPYYYQGPILVGTFRIAVAYFRAHGTRSTTRRAEHKLIVMQNLCSGSGSTIQATALDDAAKLDCEDYSAVLSGFAITNSIGLNGHLCGFDNLTGTVEPVV